MKLTKTTYLVGALLIAGVASAAVISATNKWSWGEGVGWINWNSANGTAVSVTDTAITGQVWSQTYGWINLAPTNASTTNTCAGNVGGYAWGERIGWINMDGVTISPLTGKFGGSATTTNHGNIAFSGTNFSLETDWRCSSYPSDSDGDGLPDALEATIPSDANDANSPTVSGSNDADGDGITDAVEAYLAANGGTAAPGTTATTDTDGDGIPDALEVQAGTGAFSSSSPVTNGTGDDDGDGVSNAVEALLANLGGESAPGTTATTDTDSDGISDVAEVANGTDPISSDSPTTNGGLDTDGDGVSNATEALIETLGGAAAPGTSRTTDTDGDGIPDVLELQAGTSITDSSDPTVGGAGATDTDGDGISDAMEVAMCNIYPTLNGCSGGVAETRIDPNQDSDNDGASDYDEIINGLDPSDPAVGGTNGSSGGNSGGGGGSTRYVCKDQTALNYTSRGREDNRLCKYDSSTEKSETSDSSEEEDVEDTGSDSNNAESIDADGELTNELQETVDELLNALGETKSEAVLSENVGTDSGNTEAVNSLVEFLNTYEGENLEQDGSYDTDDLEAVKRFQEKYSREVLGIWGLSEATGFVGPTTRLKMAVVVNGVEADSCPAFTQYNSRTKNAVGSEVEQTERLLKALDLFGGAPNMLWDNETHNALIAFQEQFASTMLDPWDLKQGTGYKYKTTNKFMNELVGCKTERTVLENGSVVNY